MTLLIISIFALFAGPLLLMKLVKPSLINTLSRIAVSLVLVLILWHVVPVANEAGWEIIILPFIIGIALPWAVEKSLHKATHTSHEVTLAIALFGLLLHAAVDGAGLTEFAVTQTMGLLPIGIISHRLVMGIAIWTLVSEHFSTGRSVMVLCLMSVATLSGYVAATEIFKLHDQVFFAAFEALAAGALGHMLLHKPHKH